jgi:hypothetical protein
MRIDSVSNDSAADKNDLETSDDQIGRETNISVDIPHPESQDYHDQGRNEVLDSRSPVHIVEFGLYLGLGKHSEVFITNLSNSSPGRQEQVTYLIIDCCRMACYDFYETNALWRTRHSEQDLNVLPRLFEKWENGVLKLPVDYTFFELRQWLNRIRRALARSGHDACPVTAIDSWSRASNQGFDDAERITRMEWPLGGLDVSLCEESLVNARNLCNHLRYWEGAHLLNALHMELLEPLEQDVEPPRYLELLKHWDQCKHRKLERQPRGPDVVAHPSPMHMGAARKRVRMEDDDVIVIEQDSEPTSPTTPTDAAASTEETGAKK